MTESDARKLVEQLVGPEQMDRLDRLVHAVVAENQHQNLIARSTMSSIWSRHVLDSVQLLRWGGPEAGTWLDIGTGGGFPGLAIAAVSARSMLLVEPRRRRAEFLRRTAASLALPHVEVVQTSIAAMPPMAASVISARAVASLDRLFSEAQHCATASTVWILPRGTNYDVERDAIQRRYEGTFHVEQSLTNSSAGIVIASKVARR